MLSKFFDWVRSLVSKPEPVSTAKNDFFAEASRDPRWKPFRNNYLVNKRCAICDSTENLELHHKKSFHDHPELELDPGNVVALCENPSRNCHFVFGHLMNWRLVNDDIDNTIMYFQLLRKKAKMKANRRNADKRP
jgi:5-methylcytosine-specific restriction protein A